jgi:hypothetical protein
MARSTASGAMLQRALAFSDQPSLTLNEWMTCSMADSDKRLDNQWVIVQG